MTGFVISSGELTADGIVYNGRTLLAGVQIITDGTNDATVILYDNTAASGKQAFQGGCPGAEDSKFIGFDRPVRCENGLYLDITGTGASCIVYTG